MRFNKIKSPPNYLYCNESQRRSILEGSTKSLDTFEAVFQHEAVEGDAGSCCGNGFHNTPLVVGKIIEF